MLTDQKLTVLNDNKCTMILRNTFDCSVAQKLAHEATQSGGGRFGTGSGQCIALGHIPPEMWNCDPWLIAAENARRAGDLGEYTKNVKKFFELYPAFAISTRAKYVHGTGGLA